MAKRFPQATALLEELVDAIDKNKPKKLESVLARGVDVNATLNGYSGPHSPFRRAVYHNNYAAAVALLDAGARLAKDDLNLVWAVGTGRVDIVQRFIEEGADVHIKTIGGTPIQVAAVAGHAQIIRLLIQHGADINAASLLGTPLQRAVDRNHTDAALSLLEAGASLDVTLGNKTLVQLARANKNRVLVDALTVAATKPRKAPSPPQPVARSKTATTKAAASTKPRDPRLPDYFPDFAARAKRRPYLAAVADLEKRCGTPRQPMKHAAGGFTFHLHSANAKRFDLDRVHTELLERGAYVFTTDSLEKNRIAILPTTDKYEVLLAMGTNGANYDLAPQDVVAWLRELEKEQPFVVTGVGWDFLDGRFTSKIKDPAKLAKRMLEFCPDHEDAKAVEAQLRKSPRMFFWWD